MMNETHSGYARSSHMVIAVQFHPGRGQPRKTLRGEKWKMKTISSLERVPSSPDAEPLLQAANRVSRRVCVSSPIPF